MKPRPYGTFPAAKRKSNHDLIARNGAESEACAKGKNSAAVIESNTMASATLTAIKAQPALSRSPARGFLEAKAMHAASKRQSPRKAKPPAKANGCGPSLSASASACVRSLDRAGSPSSGVKRA